MEEGVRRALFLGFLLTFRFFFFSFSQEKNRSIGLTLLLDWMVAVIKTVESAGYIPYLLR